MIELGDFFDTLADRWDEICVHDADKLNYILEHAGIEPGMHLLDIGCGTGVLEQFLLTWQPGKIVAVDLSPRMIERARDKYRTPLVDFRCMDVLDIRSEVFDVLLAYSVYPHFEDPQRMLNHFSRLLKPGGRLVVCHSESREMINGHHRKNAGRQSDGLPPATELARLMEPLFDLEYLEDNDRLYMVCGTKKG